MSDEEDLNYNANGKEGDEEEEKEVEQEEAEQEGVAKPKQTRKKTTTQPKHSKAFFRNRAKNPKAYIFTPAGDLQSPGDGTNPPSILSLPYYTKATPQELDSFDQERIAKLSAIEATFDATLAELRTAIADWKVTGRASPVIELQMRLRVLDAQRTALRTPLRWTKDFKKPTIRDIFTENRYEVRKMEHTVYGYSIRSYPNEVYWKESSKPIVKEEEEVSSVSVRMSRPGKPDTLFLFSPEESDAGILSLYSLISVVIGERKYISLAHAYEGERALEFQKTALFKVLQGMKNPMIMRNKALSVVGPPKEPMTLLLQIIRSAIRHKAFAEALRATENAILVFADPKDNLLGIGLSADNADAEDPSKWKGQNLFGTALMTVRKEIPEGELTDMAMEGGAIEEATANVKDAERRRYFIGLQQRKLRFS